MTTQSKLSQYKINKVRFDFENTQPLSDDQILVSNSVLEIFETPSDMPKTIQLIAQPQSGKTNTVINMVALIHLSCKLKFKDCNLYYFQPSCNELKDQVNKRFGSEEAIRYYATNINNSDFSSSKLPQPFNDVHTPTNITGLSRQTRNNIENGRIHNEIMIFIHDESHHSIGEKNMNNVEMAKKKKELAKLTNFFKENHIMFGSEHESLALINSINTNNLYEINPNHNNEIYINISASPADLMKYNALCVENNLTPFVKSFYLKPHANYLSFKDIKMKNRFKSCFEINNKKGTVDNVRRFVVSVVCQYLLLSKPGCLIVRLNPGVNSDFKIRQQIKFYNNHNEELISDLNEFLDPELINPTNIEIITTNLLKLNTLNFVCNAEKRLSEDLEQLKKDYPIVNNEKLNSIKNTEEFYKKFTQNEHNQQERQRKEFKLINDCDNIDVPIGTIDYFMKDEFYQQGEYRILCITNSFLQGKTFDSLDKVRGWFDRDRDEDSNNAFTIQSVGRNCGPHKNKNYTYPIWTNVDEINRMIEIYEKFEENSDDYGLIDLNIFADPAMSMTNTTTKLVSSKDKKVFFRNRHMSGQLLSNESWEADFFSSKADAENWIHEKLNINYPNFTFEGFSKDAHGISVAKNNANNVLGDLPEGNYGHYRKDRIEAGEKVKNPYGLIHLDDINTSSPKHIEAWSNTIQNPNSTFYNKQNYYIAFVERSQEEKQKLKDEMSKEIYTKAKSGWQTHKSPDSLMFTNTITQSTINNIIDVQGHQNQNILDEIAQVKQQLAELTRQLSSK